MFISRVIFSIADSSLLTNGLGSASSFVIWQFRFWNILSPYKKQPNVINDDEICRLSPPKPIKPYNVAKMLSFCTKKKNCLIAT